jgi:hypothetical protein
MKLVDQPTEWVLVRVSTCPAEESVDYVLLHLTLSDRIALEEQCAIRDQVKHEEGLHSISFQFQPYGWYRFDSEGISHALTHRMLQWSFIEFDADYELSILKAVPFLFYYQYISHFPETATIQAMSATHKQLLTTREFPLGYILDRYREK